ncbi:MAG: LTA synthase family protein [Velocimicrobium sp.]
MKKIIQKMCGEKTIQLLNRYSLFFQWILSCGICFLIETCSRHSIMGAINFLFDRSWVFLYNSSIIFATFFIVYFFKRRALARYVVSSAWLFLGFINGCLLLKRVTPFGYTDLKLITDLFQMKNNYFNTVEAIAGIAVVVVVVGVIFFLWRRGPKFKGKCHYITNIALVASCFVWIPAATQAAVHSHLLTNYFSNIALGYEKYGFVYGFSTSVVDRGMSQPNYYSKDKIEEIQKEVDVPKTKSDKPNIIVVLLESFIDPDEVKFLQCSSDPIPNFHALSKQYSSGYLDVPVVGAGTANTEFEILTGMSMRYFGVGEYPYKTILKTNSCESIASDLNDIGYGTHVVHNNGGNFYSRRNAFRQMGFDTFTSKELMNITSYTPIGTWAKDDILLGEVEKALDSTPNQSDFVYTITVQGHGDYPKEKVIEDPGIQVSGVVDKNGTVNEGMRYAWEYYINEIHEVDQFIGNLTEQLSKRNEKTIVILFGDHLPSLSLGKEDMKANDIFKTKYVTWNNFGVEKKDAELTAYQLLADMTNQIGIHEGTMFTYHQSELDLDSDSQSNGMSVKQYEKENLRKVELLQYDILYGNRYAYKGEDLYPASDLIMGTQDVLITKVETTYDKKNLIFGKNFTPWSKVYINGDRRKTDYITGKELQIDGYELKSEDHIVVNQMGSQSSVFRSSNEYIYEE